MEKLWGNKMYESRKVSEYTKNGQTEVSSFERSSALQNRERKYNSHQSAKILLYVLTSYMEIASLPVYDSSQIVVLFFKYMILTKWGRGDKE